jgi:iron complex outermembrane receptor protein
MNTTQVLLITLSLIGQVSAQEYSFETIEIKADKEKKSYLKSTESLSVYKAEDKATPITDNSIETVNGVANVTVNKEDDTFTIRGVKNVGVTGYQKDNLASILVDNIFQTDLAVKAGSFNLWDLQSLEIFRGAQSTTQGINSLAGSFNIFHNSPTSNQENALKVQQGSYGKMGLNLMANTPIIDGKLYSRFSGMALTSDGYISNKTTNNEDWAKKENYNANVDVLYKINDQDEIKFTNKVFKSNVGGNYVHGPNPQSYQVFEDSDSKTLTNNVQSGIEFTKSINDQFANQVNVNYSNSNQKTATDSDLTAANRTGVRNDYHRDNFVSFENLFKYNSENFNNVTGVHFHHFSLIDNYDFNVIPMPNNPVSLNIKQYVDRKRNTFAVFDTFLYEFTDRHSVNIGGRYEYVSNDYLTNVSGARVGTTGNAGQDAYLDNYVKNRSGAYGGDKGQGTILPKAGYLYTIDNNTFGVSFVEGYRTGGVSINRYRTTAVNYDPENTFTYELSHKAAMERFNVSSNLFYTKWKDQQVQIQLSNDSYDTQVTNAANSEYFGGEVQTSAKITDDQNISFSAGYLKSRFVDFKYNNKNYSNKEFPNAPNWTLMLNHGINFQTDWQFRSTLRYLGKSFADAENTKDVPEQFYVDLGLQYFYGNFVPEITVKNLLNNKYAMNSFTNLYGTYYQMSAPREIVGSLSYVW